MHIIGVLNQAQSSYFQKELITVHSFITASKNGTPTRPLDPDYVCDCRPTCKYQANIYIHNQERGSADIEGQRDTLRKLTRS